MDNQTSFRRIAEVIGAWMQFESSSFKYFFDWLRTEFKISRIQFLYFAEASEIYKQRSRVAVDTLGLKLSIFYRDLIPRTLE